MRLKNNKNIKSFRKALTVPFFLCLLAFLIPSVKSTYEWLELKILDVLFTYYPQICEITGKTNKLDSPAVIITKDQSFQSKFGRTANRSDYAELLNKLQKQGVKIAAIDFIFDEAVNDSEDRQLAEKLASFSYPILAHNFIGRGLQSFNYADIKDEKADRPLWPDSLYRPIAEKAAAKGLINIPSDLDSVIRYAPLVFHPDDSDGFLPTLGFTTWIAALISKEERKIALIDIAKASTLEEAMSLIYSAAPYDFVSTGHDGLDRSIFNLEALFISRNIINKYPRLSSGDLEDNINSISSNRNTKSKTWIKMPKKPLPLIGSYHTPCIRLTYKKLSVPSKGDGIETVSMSNLIQSEKEEENSAFMLSKNILKLLPDMRAKTLKIMTPAVEAGSSSLSGKIIRVTGKGVANANVWAIMPQSGYWQKTHTDPEGNYELTGLPQGSFAVIAYINYTNGCDQGILSVDVKEGLQSLPLLVLDEAKNKLNIPLSLASSVKNSQIWIQGEVIPMVHSDSEGKIGFYRLPEDYSFISLDEDEAEEAFTVNEKGYLLKDGDRSAANKTLAVMPENDSWRLNFYRKVSLNVIDKDITIDDLPSSLDSAISLVDESSDNKLLKKIEQPIVPGLVTRLETLPMAFNAKKSFVKLNFTFDEEVGKEARVILLDESGKEQHFSKGQMIEVQSGDYLVMTEIGKARGIYKSKITDKEVVFLGTSVPTDQDFIVTPINFLDKGFNRMPGVNVHANLFTSLINQDFFYALPFHMDSSPNYWPLYQLVLILPIFWLLSIRFKSVESTKSTLIVIFIILSIAVIAAYLFLDRILVPVFYPSMLILSFSVTRGFVEWINSRRQAHETQAAFGRFISADVVAQIVNNPDAIKPGGEKKELTIIFTDIAGFTSISEKLEAEELTTLMNNYLDEMTNILFKHGGTLDKYIGDAIMGFWNHPATQEDHTTRAVSCAIDMQKKLRELREKWIAQGLPKVEMRAGINSGNCMVGFMGSQTQMNFTCLGDSVNLASRLEGANKAYGTFIMISESVKRQLNPYLFSTRFLDFLAVKGKEQPVLVYEVRGWLQEEDSVWKDKAGDLYQLGIDSYLAREWDKAISLFKEVLELFPDDGPSKVYIERCRVFKQDPPPEKWDGRYILKTK